MDIQKLTIGQMAELNHVTRQTLRHYEAEGLLIPYYTEPDTSYRYYHINQSAKLDMIQYLKFCGMSLHEIKRQFEVANIDDIQSFLTTQLDFINESIRRLNQSRRMIMQTIENYTRYKSLPSQIIFHEYIPSRKIYVHTSEINFFDECDSGYEMMLRELKTSLIDKNLPTSYFCNIGTIMRKPCLEKRRLYSNEVFVFVGDDDMPDANKIVPDALESIPGGAYVSLCSGDIFKEAEYAGQLLDYIREHGYTITGDYICEVVAEFPIFGNTQRSMLYKIQIPVKLKE
jgi:DNA-binding transcriptional MerR regulator